MSNRNVVSAILAIGLANLAAIGPLRAADLDTPYVGSQQFPEDKVEFGSGWYIRGDIAATDTYALGVGVDTVRRVAGAQITPTNHLGYDLSLGGGYKLTSWFRGDVTGDFHQPIQSNIDNATCISSNIPACSIKGKFAHYDVLANGYVDLGTWAKMTPYLGAGAGVGFGETNVTLYDGTSVYVARSIYHNFAWALMAGASVDVYDHTKLDIGYRYLNNGRVLGHNVYYHEVRAGVRYMIDE